MKITDYKTINTPEFSNLTAENFAARLKQANLTSKSDITNYVNKADFDNKLLSFNKRVNSNKTKHLLVENELKNYRHSIQVSSLVKITLIMMEHNFT